MSLPPRTSATWSEEIGTVAAEYMNATAKFYTSAKVLKITSKARVQHLRAPLDSSSPVTWGTQRAIRLQIPLNATSGAITKGWLVQISGANDPTLNLVTMTVQSAVNSSHAALRTIECISDLSQTDRA